MTAFVDQPEDPLAFLLFNSEGKVFADRDLADIRRFQTFVNEAGIQQSCVTCDDVGVRKQEPNGLAPQGYTRKTKACCCVNVLGKFFDVRISRVREGFNVGDLAVLRPGGKLAPELRAHRKFNSFKIVALTKSKVHAHRLVSAPGVPVHVNLERENFQPVAGSESALVQRTLEMVSGRVFLTSFAPIVFDNVASCTPRELVIEQPLALDILQSFDYDEKVEQKEPERPKPKPKVEAAPKKRPAIRVECRAAKKLKGGEGCSRLTAFFAVKSNASAVR